MGTRIAACWLLFMLAQQWVIATQASVGWVHAVVIDAGSTGSRVHVYKYYTASSNSPWATVDLPGAVYKTTPGLSSYGFDPRTAANSLKPLLKFAKQKIPEDQWHSTPIQLLATAGLRMLNNSSADAILHEVRALLASSGLSYQGPSSARVLSGREEGLWGWVAVNYATGALQAATADTALAQRQLGRKDIPASAVAIAATAAPMQGVLELGGASMQVTFMPKGKLPAGHAADLALPRLGADRVYSYSFDGLGLQAVQTKWSSQLAADNEKQDPCLPKGYSAADGVHGSSDWGACKSGVKDLVPINKTCLYQRCGIAGTFLPHVDGAVFLGLDNFYYTARLLGLPTNKRVSVNQLDKAANNFCHQNWRKIRSKYFKRGSQNNEPYGLKICLSSALIISILSEGLQLDRSAPVLTASNSLKTPSGKDVEVNWALGALLVKILELGGKPISSAQQQPHIASLYRASGDAIAAATAASFCLIMIMLTSCAAYCRVGVGAPIVAKATATATSGRVSPLAGLGSIRAAIGGALQHAKAGGSSGGSQSNARYQRVRPLSPDTVANGVLRPNSAAAAAAGATSGGGTEAAAGFQTGRTRTSEGVSGAKQQAKQW